MEQRVIAGTEGEAERGAAGGEEVRLRLYRAVGLRDGGLAG